MRTNLTTVVGCFVVLLSLSGQSVANPADQWWDEAWPYRIPVTASGSGVVQVSIDFTAAYATLGLNGALLDLRSVRVVPYSGSTPLSPLPYEESLSTMLEDADSPQIGWHGSGVYWNVNDGSAVADGTRFTQGSGSLKATVENWAGGYGYPGVELRIASAEPLTDWRPYESFIYDVWPQVNASARDQSPDLYSFKLYNTNGCASTNLTQGGPPLALDGWNPVSVSLKPLHTCTTPNLSNITRMEFHTRDNETVNGNSGLWDDGDQLVLWFDNLRLVDQDGGGTLEWAADGSTSKYYVYFDVLEHEGHPLPTLTNLGAATIGGAVGPPEAGGYLHRITGASTGNLDVWSAPPIEKISLTAAPPTRTAPLRIHAAREESEPFQLVVRSGSSQSVAVTISDFTSGAATIPASAVRLHRVDYVTITQLSDHFGRLGMWPDPLYPIAAGASVPLTANRNQPLWFTVRVPRDAAPGIYQATVGVGAATIPVELEVWDFTMPQKIHLASEWGFGWSSLVEEYKGTISGSVQACYWDLVSDLYQDFADHRLTPKGVGWPAGLNYPGGVDYDCAGNIDPYIWGQWGFDSLADRYLAGSELTNGTGFPSFMIRGPSSNWPPNSRPGNFCSESRGDDPPGNSAYNSEYFDYLAAVSDYLGVTADYADKGYYHIVNEPQTFADYDIVAYLAQETQNAAPNVRVMVSEQVEPMIHSNPTYPGADIDIWMPTISNYQVARAHDRQQNYGEEVWWYFLYGDRPPLPNPTVIDRTGLEGRIVPWLAWQERVDGLLYYSTTDWNPDPWSEPWINDGNGDGFMFYPPSDNTIAFDACDSQSNRLVPSIRWELLREGMEDYEYLWMLNGGAPQIGVTNQADALVAQLAASRTLYSRVPTDLYATRAAIATALQTGVSSNGFESGDTSAWSSAASDGLAVKAVAADTGRYGLEVTVGACSGVNGVVVPAQTVSGTLSVKSCDSITVESNFVVANGGDATLSAAGRITLQTGFSVKAGGSFAASMGTNLVSFLQDDSPSSETNYSAEFSVNLDDVNLGGGDEIVHFAAYANSGIEVLRALLRNGPAMVLEVRDDAGTFHRTGAIGLTPGWNRIMLTWESSSSAITSLTINEGVPELLSNLDTDTQRIDFVRWGTAGGTLATGSGTIALDEFRSWR